MTILLSAASLAASTWVIWRIRRNSGQLDHMEADMSRMLDTMET